MHSLELHHRAEKVRTLAKALLRAFGPADQLPELVETLAPELWTALCERAKVRVGNSAPLGSATRTLLARELRETIALFRSVKVAS